MSAQGDGPIEFTGLAKRIHDEKIFVEQCDAVYRNEILPDQAAHRLADYIVEQLDKLGQPANVRNAVHIAQLVSAKLFPDQLLSRFDLQGAADGDMSDFSNAVATVEAPYRGASIALGRIKNATAQPSRSEAAEQIRLAIEQMGHLPDPKDVVE